MEATYWDLAALVWLVVFICLGAKKGLILSLGTLILTILGYAAGFWALTRVAPQLGSSGLLDTAITDFLVFLVAFFLVRLVGGWLLRTVNRVGRLPVIRQLNGLGGGIAGLIRGILMLLLVGQLLALAGLTPGKEALSGSILARYFFVGFLS